MENLQQEDTVSADRKERLIFDPKTGKSRKTSSVVSRQNFNNDKYGNRNDADAKEDETPKSNNSNIKFVTGTAGVDGVKKEEVEAELTKQLAETMIKKSLSKVKIDKHTGVEDIPFDGPYTKTPDTVVDKSGAKHTAYSRVRNLARQGMKQVTKEEIELTQEETDMSEKLTYTQFVEQLNEYNSKDGVYRHKGTYAGGYSADDGDDDEPKKPAAPAVKRGRGRPAGSKSGANQKVTTGKSYGGVATHTLSLPNSK